MENYLTQKYLKSDAGGLVGKVFRKDDENGNKSGRFKCEICNVQMATGFGDTKRTKFVSALIRKFSKLRIEILQ